MPTVFFKMKINKISLSRRYLASENACFSNIVLLLFLDSLQISARFSLVSLNPFDLIFYYLSFPFSIVPFPYFTVFLFSS